MRVRAFTQDDAHIFMLPEQINEEVKGVIRLIDSVYKTFGFQYHVELSTPCQKIPWVLMNCGKKHLMQLQ